MEPPSSTSALTELTASVSAGTTPSRLQNWGETSTVAKPGTYSNVPMRPAVWAMRSRSSTRFCSVTSTRAPVKRAGTAVRAVGAAPAGMDPADRAIGRLQAVFPVEHLGAVEDAADRQADPRPVLRVDAVEEGAGRNAGRADVLLDAVEEGEAVVDVQELAWDVPVPGAGDTRCREGDLELPLRVGQAPLDDRPPDHAAVSPWREVSHIDLRGEEVHEIAGLVEDRAEV